MRQGDGRLPEERQAAIRVRDYIRSLFPKNIARICIRDWDKFGGRVLGDLYLENGQSISDILIDEGWARPYHGDKKRLGHLQNLLLTHLNRSPCSYIVL